MRLSSLRASGAMPRGAPSEGLPEDAKAFIQCGAERAGAHLCRFSSISMGDSQIKMCGNKVITGLHWLVLCQLDIIKVIWEETAIEKMSSKDQSVSRQVIYGRRPRPFWVGHP